jgi:hypothetical protein
MRVLRLLFGIYVLWQSISMSEWMLGLAGLLLAGMAILNIGCCGTNGCAYEPKQKQTVAEGE